MVSYWPHISLWEFGISILATVSAAGLVSQPSPQKAERGREGLQLIGESTAAEYYIESTGVGSWSCLEHHVELKYYLMYHLQISMWWWLMR